MSIKNNLILQLLEYKNIMSEKIEFNPNYMENDDIVEIILNNESENTTEKLTSEDNFIIELSDKDNCNNIEYKILTIPLKNDNFGYKIVIKIKNLSDFMNSDQKFEINNIDICVEKFNTFINCNIYIEKDDDNYIVFRLIFNPIESKIDEDINIDTEYCLYNFNKASWLKSIKKKIKIKDSSISNIKFNYDDIVYQGLSEPFILRLIISAPFKLPVKSDKYIGIINEGNTCYMNSILQCLFHLKILRKYIYEIPVPEDHLIFNIQKIFYNLQNEKNPIRALDLLNSLGMEKSEWNSQQDAQEIFSRILDTVTEIHSMQFDNSQFSYLIEGSLIYTITCEEIELNSKRTENFLFLQLDIENCKNLNECIEKLLRVEKLIGDNRYQTNDGNYHDARMATNFEKIPQILFIQFKRFKYTEREMFKDHTSIEYPSTIDMGLYYSTGEKNSPSINYSLYSVIVHQGQINSGHYFTYINDIYNKQWVKYNDKIVTIANNDEVYKSNYGGKEDDLIIDENGELYVESNDVDRSAYILVYIQMDKINNILKDIKMSDVNLFNIDTRNSY